MKWSFRVGRLLGIDVYLHFTFLLLLGFLAFVYWRTTQRIDAALVGVGFFVAGFAKAIVNIVLLVLGALAGVDPADPATAASQSKAAADYTKYLDPHGLKGARIGVVRKLFGFNDAVDRLMDDALAEMKRQGAEITDPVEIETLEKFGKFRYGSKHVNVFADATVAGGLGTFGYDDEGVPARPTQLMKDGVLVGRLHSRRTAVAH